MAKDKEVIDLRDEIELEQRVEYLQQVVDRTLRRLEREKQRNSNYEQVLINAVQDAFAGLRIPKVPKPPTDRRRKGEEVALPLVSDQQMSKVTFWENVEQYNTEICEERMELYAGKIIEVTEVQRSDHPVRRAVVAVLGDVIEGEGIFPGQSYLIDGGLYRQITVDGPRIMVNFFRNLLTTFDEIEVVWVIGNHGRVGARSSRNEHDPETNGDRMLGKIVQMLMADEPRISFRVKDGRRDRNWYDVVTIGNYSALCIHGDQIRGHSGFPWYGLGKKVNGWASGSIPEQFQDVLMGHWHQAAKIPLNKRDVYVNGSTESYNTYAQENLASMSDPSQWLLFVHPEKGRVTAAYDIDLSETKKAA